jgi:hypothetical protein
MVVRGQVEGGLDLSVVAGEASQWLELVYVYAAVIVELVLDVEVAWRALVVVPIPASSRKAFWTFRVSA